MRFSLVRRYASWAFMVLAVAFLIVAVVRQWPAFSAAASRVDGWSIAGAAVAGLLALGCALFAWRNAIAATSKKIPLGDAAHTYFVSQLGKYVPGAVWPVVAQMELMRKYGVARANSALGSILAMVVGLGSAVLVGTVGIFLAGGSIASYWWLLPIAAGCAAALVPPLLRWALQLAARIHTRFTVFADVPIKGSYLLQVAGWSALGWLFWGIHAWFILGALVPSTPRLFWFAIGSFAVAWAVGFVIIIAPGGIGPRELALTGLLSTVATPSDALALVIITRLLMTLLDVAVAAGAA
ncbi:MAG: flippase-like domain-containing protein, partial [Cellulomonadaceae bacterium]|nr:flippase-like domain-containing protein [Cellulomonadaceae bacterium]